MLAPGEHNPSRAALSARRAALWRRRLAAGHAPRRTNTTQAERRPSLARLRKSASRAAQAKARVSVAASTHHTQIGGAGARTSRVAGRLRIVPGRIAIGGPLRHVASEIVDALG